ncbi:MAG: OsmC family protein, partial [Spirochaetota bacterium]
MDMKISFGGKAKVTAEFRSFSVTTDQPVEDGGEDAYPSPFDLFIVSLGTCAGIYVQRFCEERNIDYEHITMNLSTEEDDITGMLKNIHVKIELPEDFPGKYKKAVVNAAGLCT